MDILEKICIFLLIASSVVFSNFLFRKMNRQNLTTKDDHYKYHYIASLLREDGKSFTIHLYSDYGYHKSSDILEFLWSGRLQKYILLTPQGFVVLSTKKQLSEFKFEVMKQK